MALLTTRLLAVLALSPCLALAQYSLVKEYSGSSFFDDWTFYNHFDNLTNGDVVYVSASQGKSDQLAFVNSAGNAIIKVDNTTDVTDDNKRNSVRITTNDAYGLGSVWVADMIHVPYGCSVWPSWWSQAPNWPTGGEIDTFEAVNLQTQNQMSMHTEPGCTQVNAVQSSTLINSTDCSFEFNNNQGCQITDPSTASYGVGFANAGGGVFVTEYADAGISVWFFSRPDVPSSLQGNSTTSLNTTALGTPVANWPTGGCSVTEFFQPQNLIFDITLCGDYAGNDAIFNETCSGVCYDNYVAGSGSNYATAYFEVQSVRVFTSNSSAVIKGSGSSSGAPSRASFPLWTSVMAGAAGLSLSIALSYLS